MLEKAKKNLDSPLKDNTGRYLTRALFVELTTDKEMEEKYPPRCTLKEAHDLYMEIADPTEYEFAKALLDSDYTTFWDQWRRIANMPDFLVFLTKWREELDVKIRSTAIRSLMDISASDDKGSAVASKWLAEKGYAKRKGAGRPSSEEIERERHIAAALTSTVEEDANRISLVKNGGV